jgi:hypothetical protein
MSVNSSIYTTQVDGITGQRSDGVAVSSTNTYYSDMITGKMADGCAVQLSWTGTPTGTFTYWVSDKAHPSLADDTDWVQDTGFAPTNPAGSAGKMHDDTAVNKARWKRIKYVNASGTGTLFGYATVAEMS